ncbi:MAG TPA: hypothetical protein PLI93_07075 [Gemmatimonadales bacterium]|nr:hypothetical protein [Gemmatimonadota bacterium]HPF61809.1 hypothetical protein [Gemmatimonadales bacterium]HRX18575.1 hypothetical protein [Gemmatimonadales bacterium]
MSTTPAEPFTRASIYLGPLLEAHGFRLVAREYGEEADSAAFAEYQRGDLALRLVWEPEARALWLESARTTGGSIISRWIDIEWSVAGTRQPLDTALDDARLERLGQALGRFLLPDGRPA